MLSACSGDACCKFDMSSLKERAGVIYMDGIDSCSTIIFEDLAPWQFQIFQRLGFDRVCATG